MSKKPKPGKARIAAAISGGPGNFRGCEYQTDYAVLKTLDLVSQQLYAPLNSLSITVEPRVLHPEGVTRWDIATSSPATVSEAKANLSKDDLVEFLVRAGETEYHEAEIELIYGRCSTALLNPAIRLRGIAIECGPDHSQFDELVAREEIPNAQIILNALGPDYRPRLLRLSFENLPEKQLKRELEFRSRYLSPEQPVRLLDFLFRRLFEGATCRRRYDVTEIVNLIEQEGMALARPAEVNLAQLDPSVALALAFLQAVPSGLPGEVVASAAGATTQQLQDMLPNSDWVSIDENAWRIRPLPFQVPVQSRTDLLCRGFEGLLSFLSSHETDKRSEEQLRNAISLSRACLRVRPELALPLFQASEHIVKNMGDRHLLLEISDLCIDAGRQSCGGDNERRACACARAQAMLCGTSWVLQRTNRLAEARSWAEKSLRLGQDIGWDRNTGFAKKCMGRLDRIQAEQPVSRAEDKASLLRESATKLQEAIQIFSNLREFGPTNRQVGDCYSLLARTYLTAGKRGDMEAALRKAYEILNPGSTKMYFDLLILDGDYEVAWGKRELAEERYTEVISHHSQESREHSEIYARALSRRAANRSKLGRKQPAILDYGHAARAWRSLGEFEEEARAEWERTNLEGKIDSRTLDLFINDRSPLDWLCALKIYLGGLEGAGVLARRSRPTRTQAEDFLKRARESNALNYPEW